MSKKRKLSSDAMRFSRQWWLGFIRNAAWIIVVTALVWIYADMEFTDTSQDLRVTINLTTGKDEGLMLLGKSDVEVTFRVQGNRSGLADFNRWLKDRGMVLEYDVSDNHRPSRGPVSVPSAAAIAQMAGLSERGLTVSAVDPAAISFHLENRKHVLGVPVKAEFIGGNALAEPAKVNIYVGETAWSKVPADKQILRTKPIDLKNLPSDGKVSAEIIPSIMLADGTTVPVVPEQDSVKVQVRVEKLTDTKKITVPLRVLGPMSWTEDNTWSDYKFVLKAGESRTIDLEIEGAKADLDSLAPADIDAYIILQDSDKTPVESWLDGKVFVNLLKPNIKLVGERPKVKYKLLKRDTPTAVER
jgi:hypothetical protein